MDTDKSFRPYIVELVGTFALVLISAGAVLVDQLAAITWHKQDGLAAFAIREGQPAETGYPVVVGEPRLGLTGIALAAGLAYAAALAVSLPVSNGFLNPAMTLMMYVFKRLDLGKALGLIGAQVLGAVLAGLALRGVFASREDVLVLGRMGAPHLSPDTFAEAAFPSMLKGLGVELALTFLLAFAIFGTCLDPRARKQWGGWAERLAPLWLGLMLAACTFVGFNLTGAALNPARWLGPTVWEMTLTPLVTLNPWKDHPAYWIGPIAGALLAGTLYHVLILPADEHAALAAAANADLAGRPGNVTSTLYKARK
jgi:glycerol uptake facilitator-like aquaporin